MPEYRRSYVSGGTYFFTLITYKRKHIFNSIESIKLLYTATSKVIKYHPFKIDAYCILPDHIHTIWTMPQDDFDYSRRIAQIKRYFSKIYDDAGFPDAANRTKRRERAIWQRRFWEHSIRKPEDLKRHVEYIHFNPVKHGLVTSVKDWPYSSFFKFVEDGLYAEDWGSQSNLSFEKINFGE